MLGVIGLAQRKTSRARCVQRASDRALAALTDNRELRATNLDRARALIGDARATVRIDPAALEQASRAGAAAFRPDLLAQLLAGVPFQPDDTLERQAVAAAFEAALDCLLADPEVQAGLTQDLLLNQARDAGLTLTVLGRIEGKVDDLAAMMAQLLAASGKTDQARASGIADAALVGLARRIARDVENPEQAFRELEAAVEVAIRVQAEGRVGSNHGDFVDTVLARVAELSRDGKYDAAVADIDAALAQEAEESAARTLRLLDAGIAQDTLRRDPAAVAARQIRKAEIEGKAGFDDLRALQGLWYMRGRDAGLNFDLAVSLDLARLILPRARDTDQRGAAGNDLGIALHTLGARESRTERLQEAVAAFRAALTEWTRNGAPLDWATVQNNFGAALQALGERESGTARLEEAVVAYRLALTERTQDRVPLDWATTQNNLGSALAIMGERESGTVRLKEAVAAFRASMQQYLQDRVPLDWAMTQNNIGNVLQRLGERESGTVWLKEAVAAYRSALTVYTQDRVPLDWAMTQNNLGNVLATLGSRESDKARLEEAVAAYRAALTERRRDRVPLEWATTQNNLGNALAALGSRESSTSRLDEAATAYRSALTERRQELVPLDWATTQNNLGTVLRALSARESGTARLAESVAAYRAALMERTQVRVPLDWATTTGNLGVALSLLADRTGDLVLARQALDQIATAERVLREGGHTAGADIFARRIPVAQAVIERLAG